MPERKGSGRREKKRRDGVGGGGEGGLERIEME